MAYSLESEPETGRLMRELLRHVFLVQVERNMAPSLGKRCMSFGLRLVSLTNWIPCASGQGWTKDRGTYGWPPASIIPAL